MNILQPVFDQLHALLPSGSQNDKTLRLALYQELAKGTPISSIYLAEKLGEPLEKVERSLAAQDYVEFNDKQQVVGFRGITLFPTKHKVTLVESFFFTWCAFDALFCAELIGQEAKISSSCPICDDAIRISIPKQQHNFEESDIQMSFVIPKKEHYEADLKESFCCKVHFFCNIYCGRKWKEKQVTNAQSDGKKPILELFDLTQAFAMAQYRNHYFLGKDKS